MGGSEVVREGTAGGKMAKKKRSNEQLEAENELLRQHGFGNNITKVVLALIKWGVILGLGYFTKETFVALAGNILSLT